MVRHDVKNNSKREPSPKVVAEVHALMMRDRKGRSIDDILAAVEREGFHSPAGVDQVGEFYFLDFLDPDGRNCGRIAISADEAAHPQLVGLMLS